MKKILFLVATFTVLITISGCGSKENFEFTFDNFYWYFFTNNTFVSSDIQTEWLASKLLENNIVEIYTQSQNSWYTDSIIISKKQSTQTLQAFVSQNLKKIKLEWYTIGKEKTATIRCNEEKIDINTVNSELKWNLNEIFFTQTFLIYKENSYIISFSTNEEEERDIFASDVKNIKCIENK